LARDGVSPLIVSGAHAARLDAALAAIMALLKK
jgi:hypothetical protein